MENFIIFVEMMMINIILSGDNAIIIAMASKNLPRKQRELAVWWGAAGAIFLRIVLTIVAVILLQIPLLQAIGAMFLMYIAIKLLYDGQSNTHIRQTTTLLTAVQTIIVADIVMSLDNVLAIAAITKDNVPMLVIGIALSLPLIVWGSQLIMRLLRRFPLLIVIGATILGLTAGDMFVSDPKIQMLFAQAHRSFDWAVPLFCTLFIFIFGLYQSRSKEESSF